MSSFKRSVAAGTTLLLYVVMAGLLVMEQQSRFSAGVPIMKWVLIATALTFPLVMVRRAILLLRRVKVSQEVIDDVAMIVIVVASFTLIVSASLWR
jgi:hypothetical protein